MIKIGTAIAEKGSISRGHLEVGELSMGTKINIPVVIIDGTEDGPVLWLNGGVHGDEINIVMVIQRLMKKIDPNSMKGSLICTPLSNPVATQFRQKLNPFDSLDLDQQFPGNKNGLFSQKVAYSLFKSIRENANYLINFHTAATPFAATPYTVYKLIEGKNSKKLNKEIEKMTRMFGLYINCKIDLSSKLGQLPGNLQGALDINCNLEGIPAFMAEIGSGGIFEKENIDIAFRGILNVMKYLKIISGKPKLPKEQISVIEREFIYSKRAGFMVSDVEKGKVLKGKKTIAKIIDDFEVVERIKRENDTLPLIIRKNPIVHSGDRITLVGLKWVNFKS